MARPTKLDKTTVKKLEEAFSIGASIEEACLNAGISRQTYYNWEDENKELFDNFDLLRETPILKARKAIFSGLDDPKFALKFLSRKRKTEFGLYKTETDDPLRPIEIIIGGSDYPEDYISA